MLESIRRFRHWLQRLSLERGDLDRAADRWVDATSAAAMRDSDARGRGPSAALYRPPHFG